MAFTRRRSSRLAAAAQQTQSTAENSTNDEPALVLPTAPTNPLPSIVETDDEVVAASQQTPNSSRNALSYFSSITHRTPKSKTPIQPSGDEMHPHQHRKSTTPYDEARWLGFFNMAPHTPKPSSTYKAAPASPTPTKEVIPASHGFTSPEFKFAPKRQSLDLSPEAQKMMLETREEAAKIRARMSVLPPVPQDEPGAMATTSPTRKIAKPKGKVNRFSNAHMAEFKKMDSIANHPSTWRTNPDRFKETTKTLKRSLSKAELDKPEANPFVTKGPNVATIGLSTFDTDSTPTKRIKVNRYDDASSKKIAQPPFKISLPSTPKSVPTDRRKTGLPRPLPSLMSPTKASLARSQSVKSLKTTTTIPSPVRSNSTKSLRNPFTPRTKITIKAPKPASPSPVKVTSFSQDSSTKPPNNPETTATPSKPQIKSILRHPHRLYSNDPAKIAAGTHLATPPHQRTPTHKIPHTATSAAKHVDFTASALAKAARDEVKASSLEPETVNYPSLSQGDVDSRPFTISEPHIPGSFTFRVGTPVEFVGATIRAVRESSDGDLVVAEKSGGLSGVGTSKRKFSAFVGEKEEEEEKENQAGDREGAEGERPAKRVKMELYGETRSPGRRLLGRGARGLTAARLNMLAMPRRRA